MPILHTINEELGVVLSSWVGDISDSDLLPSYKQLYQNENWKPGFNEIVDLRNAELSDVTNKGLERLAIFVKQVTVGKCEVFKTAVIAPDDLPFGLARVYEAVSVDTLESVRVFRDLKLAFEWLEIEDPLLTGKLS